MAPRANPFFAVGATPVAAAAVSDAAPYDAVAKLAHMHAEAVETARLANLLGRTPYAAASLPLMATVTVVLSGGAGLPATVAWAVLLSVACIALVRAYAHAIRKPFEHTVLHAFAQDLSACLLYGGFAWGAGAFLGLSSGVPGGAALLFASLPAAAIALLLRERQAVLLFLAPVAALTAFACVLRPFAGGALGAALVLIASAIVAAATIAAARHAAKRHEARMPGGIFAS